MTFEHSELIKTNFMQDKTWPTAYTCDAFGPMSISKKRAPLALQPSDHFSGYSAKNVTCLKLHTKHLMYLPIGGGEIFPNLREFYVFSSKLQYISKSDFDDMPDLTCMSFYKNYLKYLENDSFESVEKLESLSLSHNYLEYLPDKIFHPLLSLKRIYISHNDLKSLKSVVFEKSLKLEVIDISSNSLLHIDPFVPSLDLKELWIEKNVCTKEVIGKNVDLLKVNELLVRDCGAATCSGISEVITTCAKEFDQCQREDEGLVEQNIELKNKQRRFLVL